jgi:hypothetical protein
MTERTEGKEPKKNPTAETPDQKGQEQVPAVKVIKDAKIGGDNPTARCN